MIIYLSKYNNLVINRGDEGGSRFQGGGGLAWH
jgi:hypothetical protein